MEKVGLSDDIGFTDDRADCSLQVSAMVADHEKQTEMAIKEAVGYADNVSTADIIGNVESNTSVSLDEKSQMLSFDDTWAVVEKFWTDSAFVNDSLRSYDRFISNINKIPVPPIDVKCEANNSHRNTRHVVKFEKCYVGKPMYNEDDPNRKAAFACHPKSKGKLDNVSFVTPHEAMERSLTFAVPIYYDVVHEIWKREKPEDVEYQLIEKRLCEKLPVGDIPVPVGSICDGVDRTIPPEHRHECPYEPKGAFIVNGTRRIIVPQSRMAYNKVIVSLKVTNKPMLVAEIRSLAERDFADPAPISVKFRTFKGRGEETFRLKFPYVKYDIHLSTVFRALGIESDKQICEMMTQGSMSEQMQVRFVVLRQERSELLRINEFLRKPPISLFQNYCNDSLLSCHKTGIRMCVD